MVPYRDFAPRDDDIFAAYGSDGQFRVLCALLGRDDLAADARFADNAGPQRDRRVLEVELARAIALWRAPELIAAVQAAGVPGAPINGVLVQPGVPAGIELVVGARRDLLFGPTVLVGMGGVLVALLRDTAVAPAPVGHGEARSMLARLRGARLLSGFRNLPAVDLDALAAIVQRVSELAADHADRIAEIDVNPVIGAGARLVAVDALNGLSPTPPHG